MRAILACSVVLAVSGAVVGCGDGSGSPGTDDTGTSVDAGRGDTGADGSTPHDANVSGDGAPRTDTGVDAGSVTSDAGTDTGGTTTDAGVDAATDAGRGCTSSSDCPSSGTTTRFCEFPSGTCGGTGTCQDSGGICSAVFAPVCGCDGTTYSNAGCARAAGVSVMSDGACSTTPTCTSDAMCAGTEFCDFTDGTCGGTGTCTTRGIGRLCIMTCAPECGCNGSWYRNTCFRDQAGTSLDASGSCVGSPPCTAACGCTVDTDCATGEECVATPSGGVCHTKVTRPMCWRDSDCVGHQTCMAAGVCPCGAACLVADHPGTCG